MILNEKLINGCYIQIIVTLLNFSAWDNLKLNKQFLNSFPSVKENV